MFFYCVTKYLDEAFEGCMDIEKKTVELIDGQKGKIYFVAEAVNDITLREVKYGISDLEKIYEKEQMISAVLNGNAVLIMEKNTYALKIRSSGYPGMGVIETKNEQVMRGSNEGFSSSIKTNEVLIRKRIRNAELKIEEKIYGNRSKTSVAFIYMETIVRKEIVNAIKERLETFEIDGFMDSGVIEQLISENERTIFPQYLTTERPDRAAQLLLEGRVLLLVDNSLVALALPVDFQSFLKTADDYFNRWEIVSLERIIRYMAIFLASSLPALYIAIINFHPEVLPVDLAEIFINARKGIPYNAFFEVMFMELSFEMIREAGVRIPGTMGNAIGIVGGLIVGSAAVEASISSPIVVIVVALTALCSFAIPNNELTFSIRIIKYYLIILSALLGIFGYIFGVMTIFIHLSKIESFGFAYIGCMEKRGDNVIRGPYKKLTRRGEYASDKNKRRLKVFSSKEGD